jgi:hypothetical protein
MAHFARWQKAVFVATGVAVVLFGFLAWYKLQYSMGPAKSFEVNAPHSGPSVLIATQGSAFKDAVVAGVVDHLRTRSAYVKVVDVSALPAVNEADWNAIVVIHTWEMGKPQADAQAFVARIASSHKAVVLSTSGRGDFRMEGIDAISSASKIADVPADVAQITVKVDAILDAQPRS